MLVDSGEEEANKPKLFGELLSLFGFMGPVQLSNCSSVLTENHITSQYLPVQSQQ